MEPIEIIEFEEAIYEQDNGNVTIRKYTNGGYSPINESFVENIRIEVFDGNRYHITGFIVVDLFLDAIGDIITKEEYDNISSTSKNRVKVITKKKYWLFGPEYSYYWLKRGWYSTKDRKKLDIIHYGQITIINSDYH